MILQRSVQPAVTVYDDQTVARVGDFVHSKIDDRTGRVLCVNADGQIGVAWTNEPLTPLGLLCLEATRPAWRCALVEPATRPTATSRAFVAV